MKKHYKFEIDCANCAAKVEEAIKKIDGVNSATVSFMTQKLTLDADDARYDEILQQVITTAKKIEPDCRAPPEVSQHSRAAIRRRVSLKRRYMMATLNKKQKKIRNRILIAAVLLIVLKLLPLTGWLQAVCFLVPYFIIGYDVLRKAVLGIINGQVFDENFLMAIATVGAFATGEFDEAVFVMLFYQTGELFQDYAVGKSRPPSPP